MPESDKNRFLEGGDLREMNLYGKHPAGRNRAPSAMSAQNNSPSRAGQEGAEGSSPRKEKAIDEQLLLSIAQLNNTTCSSNAVKASENGLM